MMSVESVEEKVVAVLHDVVEDTDVTLKQLQEEGFPEKVLTALDLVTHKDGIGYDDYIAQIKSNPIARAVKLADLRDNSNVFEIPELSEKDLSRVEKYHRAYKFLCDDGESTK